MSEIRTYECWVYDFGCRADMVSKPEADKVIAEKDAEIRRLKNGIAPKHSDKSLQERLNEVCEKHGVSTLQDLDWAFCESEKRHTKDRIESAKMIARHKYKRCLAMYRYCSIKALYELDFKGNDVEWKWYSKWMHRWFRLAKKFNGI